MFKTKHLVHDIKDVPVPWVFEHFCNLKEKLKGQDVKIKSLFQQERTPSMCIYFDDKKSAYRYKDFSSGRGGSAVDLVKDLTALPYHQACTLVVEKYNDYVLHNNGGYDVQDFKHESKYRVEVCHFRDWNSRDEYFWTQFNIGSRLLEQHGVRPLSGYEMKKMKDDKEISLKIEGLQIYGYFRKDGTLYKIYQPKTQDKKFLKIRDYIQGVDQLENHPHLVIASSLKDLMSLKSLRLRGLDVVSPDSENSLIRKEVMNEWMKGYKKILVMFDNDDAGIKAMRKYKEAYDVNPILLDMSKDLSDSIRDRGAKEVRMRLIPLIDRKISE